jgi:hypothetical protein
MMFINSLWSYILVWGIMIGFANNLAFTLANDKFITNWFIKKRGLALGTRFMLMAAFGVIVLPSNSGATKVAAQIALRS